MKFAGAALLVPALLLDPTGRGAAAAAQRASGTLAVVGNGGRPARAYPLARCQGDCDGDDECQVRRGRVAGGGTTAARGRPPDVGLCVARPPPR